MADQDDALEEKESQLRADENPFDWGTVFDRRRQERAEHSLAVAPPESAHHSSGPHLHFEGSRDSVNHPSHYGGDTVYEVIKVIRKWGLGFNLGNSVKYIVRAGKKNPATEVEDLKKAVFYLEDEIAYLTGEKKLMD